MAQTLPYVQYIMKCQKTHPKHKLLKLYHRPENLKVNLRNTIEGCIILIEWDPPANVAADDVAYYWIQVNDSKRVNETITPNRLLY